LASTVLVCARMRVRVWLLPISQEDNEAYLSV
jgi:hypothetical protein